MPVSYAIIATGGKQHKVSVGDRLNVELLDAVVGDAVTFDKVLAVKNGDELVVGKPALPGANVSGTATVRGIGGQSFNEPTVGYMLSGISTSSVLRADRSTWNVLGTFTMSGSDGATNVAGAEVGWYAVDVTSFWNANVGQKITMSIDFVTNPGGDGPIFEDTQGTAFANGAYGAIANSGPRIATTAAVPEPASLALLAFAGLMVRIRRR